MAKRRDKSAGPPQVPAPSTAAPARVISSENADTARPLIRDESFREETARLTRDEILRSQLGHVSPALASARGLAHNLRGSADLWHEGEMDPDVNSPAPPVDAAFANASLGELVAAYTPRGTAHALRRMEEILTEAQVVPPPDSAAFVRNVNFLLDVLSARIRSGDGELGKLSLDRNGIICLTRSGRRGGNRGFKNTTLSLVAVPRIHGANRHTGPRHTPAP